MYGGGRTRRRVDASRLFARVRRGGVARGDAPSVRPRDMPDVTVSGVSGTAGSFAPDSAGAGAVPGALRRRRRARRRRRRAARAGRRVRARASPPQAPVRRRVRDGFGFGRRRRRGGGAPGADAGVRHLPRARREDGVPRAAGFRAGRAGARGALREAIRRLDRGEASASLETKATGFDSDRGFFRFLSDSHRDLLSPRRGERPARLAPRSGRARARGGREQNAKKKNRRDAYARRRARRRRRLLFRGRRRRRALGVAPGDAVLVARAPLDGKRHRLVVSRRRRGFPRRKAPHAVRRGEERTGRRFSRGETKARLLSRRLRVGVVGGRALVFDTRRRPPPWSRCGARAGRGGSATGATGTTSSTRSRPASRRTTRTEELT